MSKTQEQIARAWAENRMSAKHLTINPTLEAVAEVILQNTQPPTMREIVWDPKKHRGAAATDGYGNEWVMLKWNGAEKIICATPDLEKVHNIARFNLTPNGKRYKFAAEGETTRKILKTTKDYEGAPFGTIVALDNSYALTKTRTGWAGGAAAIRPNNYLGGVARRVIRWGWES